MEVNASTIKSLRQGRGWTQQHLADACDVSLRTVQRVEKFGTASNETVLGLCAVFEIERTDLSVIPEVDRSELSPVKLRDFGPFLILAGIGGFLLGILAVIIFQSF